jgi:Flp pilus assembly protein TadG
VSFSRRFREFLLNRQANIAVMFAMVATPIVGLVGFTVDFMMAERDRTMLNNMADGAVLAGVNVVTVNTTTPWRIQRERSLEAVQNHFEAALTLSPNAKAKITSTTYDVKLVDGAVQVKLCYTGEQSTQIGSLMGVSKIHLSGCTEATSAPPAFVEVHVLVDASGSMGIGASTADQQLMNRRLGCAFACHTVDWMVPPGNPASVCNGNGGWNSGRASPTCAAFIGARTRFDVVKAALNDIMNEAEALQQVPRQFVFGIHKFSNYLTTVRAAHHSIPAVRNDMNRMTMDDLGAGTNLRVALQELNRQLPVAGDGKTEHSRRVFLLLMTDGVEGNVYEKRTHGPQGLRFYGHWDPDTNFTLNTPGFWHGRERSQVIDSRMCDTIKAKGVEILTLNTEYLTPPGSGDYRFQQIQRMLVPEIRRTMEDCATNPQYAYNAATPTEIETATRTMFKSIIETARLMR